MILVAQDDDQETKVFSTKTSKSSTNKQQTELRIVIDGGPRFYMEASNVQGSYFLFRTKNNKLVGMLDKNGELDKSPQVHKLLFFNKLSLNPAKEDNQKDEEDGEVEKSTTKYYHESDGLIEEEETVHMSCTTSPAPQLHDADDGNYHDNIVTNGIGGGVDYDDIVINCDRVKCI